LPPANNFVFQISPATKVDKAILLRADGTSHDVTTRTIFERGLNAYIDMEAGAVLLLSALPKDRGYPHLNGRLYVVIPENMSLVEATNICSACKVGHPLTLLTTAAQRVVNSFSARTIKLVSAFSAGELMRQPKTTLLASFGQVVSDGYSVAFEGPNNCHLAELISTTARTRRAVLNEYTAARLHPENVLFAVPERRTGVLSVRSKTLHDGVAGSLVHMTQRCISSLADNLLTRNTTNTPIYQPGLADYSVPKQLGKSFTQQWPYYRAHRDLVSRAQELLDTKGRALGVSFRDLRMKWEWSMMRIISFQQYIAWVKPVLYASSFPLRLCGLECPLALCEELESAIPDYPQSCEGKGADLLVACLGQVGMRRQRFPDTVFETPTLSAGTWERILHHLEGSDVKSQTLLGAWVASERLEDPMDCRVLILERFESEFTRVSSAPDAVSVHDFGPLRTLAGYLGV